MSPRAPMRPGTAALAPPQSAVCPRSCSKGGHEGAWMGEFKAGYGIRASRTEKPHRRPPVRR